MTMLPLLSDEDREHIATVRHEYARSTLLLLEAKHIATPTEFPSTSPAFIVMSRYELDGSRCCGRLHAFVCGPVPGREAALRSWRAHSILLRAEATILLCSLSAVEAAGEIKIYEPAPDHDPTDSYRGLAVHTETVDGLREFDAYALSFDDGAALVRTATVDVSKQPRVPLAIPPLARSPDWRMPTILRDACRREIAKHPGGSWL